MTKDKIPILRLLPDSESRWMSPEDKLCWMRQKNGEIWVSCANGHWNWLSDHDIARDGTVTPSADCPRDGCDFHDSLKLGGWITAVGPEAP